MTENGNGMEIPEAVDNIKNDSIRRVLGALSDQLGSRTDDQGGIIVRDSDGTIVVYDDLGHIADIELTSTLNNPDNDNGDGSAGNFAHTK